MESVNFRVSYQTLSQWIPFLNRPLKIDPKDRIPQFAIEILGNSPPQVSDEDYEWKGGSLLTRLQFRYLQGLIQLSDQAVEEYQQQGKSENLTYEEAKEFRTKWRQEQMDKEWIKGDYAFILGLEFLWSIKHPGVFLVCDKNERPTPELWARLKTVSEKSKLMRQAGLIYNRRQKGENYDSIVKRDYPQYLTDPRLREVYVFMHPLGSHDDPTNKYYLSKEKASVINREMAPECETMLQCWYKAVGLHGHTWEAYRRHMIYRVTLRAATVLAVVALATFFFRGLVYEQNGFTSLDSILPGIR